MELPVWQKLAEPKHEELVRAAMGVERGDVQGIAGLRKMCPDAEVVRAALVLGEARRKAVGKFGAEVAGRLWADVAGVEMASSALVADRKASFFAILCPDMPVTDLCCGIGGDAMAFAASAGGAIAVDIDPVRAWMAGMNAGCETRAADVTTMEVPHGPFHIDPARRDGSGRRTWGLAEMQPPIETIRAIAARDVQWGAVKLGPGVDLAEVERELPGAFVEVCSENGRLVQAVAWVRGVYTGATVRRATLLLGSADGPMETWRSHTISGTADAAAGGLPLHAAEFRSGRYIYEPDDSVERAGLLGTLCAKLLAPMLHTRVGLLTSDVLIRSPWVSGFEVLEVMAFNERRVKAVLESHCAGIVEVKTRGGVVETDALQGRLRGKGDVPMVVFVLRLGREVRAIVAKRVDRSLLNE